MFGWVPGVPSGTHLTRIFGDTVIDGECRVDRCGGTCGPSRGASRQVGTIRPVIACPVTGRDARWSAASGPTAGDPGAAWTDDQDRQWTPGARNHPP
jgi:hypothetical protein